MRDFPRNSVTPTPRDLQRIVCPHPTNLRHIITALHPKNIAKNVSKSCRRVTFVTMCSLPESDPMDPLTWNPSCAMGEYNKCPKLPIDVSDSTVNEVQINVWRKGVAGVDTAGKDKERFT